MSKSRSEQIREYELKQESMRIASEALDKASAPEASNVVQRHVYLATSFQQRSDLPVTASIRKMSDKVVRNLADLGLHEPVSLRMLPGRWWKANVDAAEIGELREYGCGFVTLMLSSERLAEIGFEVIDGPFEAWANIEVTTAILKESKGKFWDACISNRPLLPVVDGAELYAGYDNAYASEELQAALDDGKTINVYSGPYDTKDAAHYRLDVRWESPE
jgi:hypothetical protein